MAKTQLYNNEIAEAFIADKEYLENLVYHEEYETFFIYRDDHYKIFPWKTFELEVYNFIRTTFPSQNIRKDIVRDVIYSIEKLCVRREKCENEDFIAFKDVLFNTKTFEIEQKRKGIFTLFYVPYNYSEIEMKTPEFRRFLETSLVKLDKDKDQFAPDFELINLVQEMMGFIMLGSLKGYKAWFLIGDGSNGKGVLTRVINNIVGNEYTTSMTIEDLTKEKYNAAELIGKKVNICNEDESKYIEAMRFKALVSGDPLHAQVKFKSGFVFTPKTKFIFCANQAPIFQKVDYGLQRRIMFICFKRKFKDDDVDRDIDLDAKLALETPGIIKWALEGAKRLVTNGYCYSACESSIISMREFEEEIMSAVAFIRERYVVTDDECATSVMQLYNEYRIYCDEVGKKPYGLTNFRKQIESNITGVKEILTTRTFDKWRGYNLIKISDYDKRIEQIKQEFDGVEPDFRSGLSQGNLPIKDG